MKKIAHILLAYVLFFSALPAFSQTPSDFEEISLPPSSYYNGNDFKGGFTSGVAFFTNDFDTTFGPYWEGFSVSNIKDDSTPGYQNQYASIAKGGVSSDNYAVFYNQGKIRMGASAPVSGFFITNSTYAYFDMKNGSAFSKKFGGTSGNDSDFFKIKINAWKNGGVPADTSIEVYLADFRFANNTNDYILKNWQWVNLSVFGNIDSLSFQFQSSDTSSFGINTPQYFCMDKFNLIPTGMAEINNTLELNVYPNPVKHQLQVACQKEIHKLTLLDLNGKEIQISSENKMDMQNVNTGIYILRVEGDFGVVQKKLIKE